MIELGALQAMEAAGLAGLRPTWCLLVVSGAMALGIVEPEGSLAFLGTWPAFAALAVIAAVEAGLEREVEVESFLWVARLVLSSGASLAASRTVADATGADVTWVHQGGGLLLALGVALLRSEARRQVKDLAQEAGGPQKWIARLEEGGLLGAAALLVLAPVLLLALILLMTLGSAGLFAAAHLLDRRRRRACPACHHPARREAVRCPGCQGRLEPDRWLMPRPRLTERLGRLARARGPEAALDLSWLDDGALPGGPPAEGHRPRRVASRSVLGLAIAVPVSIGLVVLLVLTVVG